LFLRGDITQAKQVFLQALGVMQTKRLGGNALADCLDWIATLADADGCPREAALLFGAADGQWKVSGTVRYAPERETYAAELGRVQIKLSPVEFAAAWSEGEAMSSDQAVAYARSIVERQAGGRGRPA
jgi:hypothetical protein